MSILLKISIIVLAIIGATTVIVSQFGTPFGNIDYWNVRGVWFLIFVAFFPRLTLLFSSVVSGGIFWWLGWLFAPRILVAILATVAYWNTNKVLVCISWIVALSGESSEKTIAHTRVRRRRNNLRSYTKTIDI